MNELPYNGRAKIKFDGLKLLIQIPAKKQWFVILFLCAWLAAWTSGEFSGLNDIFKSENNSNFMIFWLIGWTIGGIYALTTIIWSLFGRETITVENGILNITKGIFDLVLNKKSYEMRYINNFEIIQEKFEFFRIGIGFRGYSNRTGTFWGNERIKFDYGMKTIRFGIDIDEAEAKLLIAEIKKR